MTRYHTPVGAALAPPTPAACPEPRRRGGKRPGAGAPKSLP